MLASSTSLRRIRGTDLSCRIFCTAQQRLHLRGLTAAAGPSNSKGRPYSRQVLIGLVVAGIPFVGISIYVREWRREHIKRLPRASCALLEGDDEGKAYLWYPIDTLISDVRRSGLMGHIVKGAQSVKQELDSIRNWHSDRNFKGGLVLRDLQQPLFGEDGIEEMFEDPMRLARRECYYLYYERLPSAEIQQHIFCRGTTLKVDILTCLQFWYVYDEELDATLHVGFKNHAERLVDDLIPLLVKDERATVQVSGHSLGGAVGCILALKLIKRGYNVTRVMTIASPRFCDKQSAAKLSPLLPQETLRIEDDRDVVPFLPPFGVHLQCDKLWLIQDDVPRLIKKDAFPSWVDSVWTNFLAWEIFSSFSRKHRIPSYVNEVQKIQTSDESRKKLRNVPMANDD